ncbi:hypothetical protein [Chryseobacterium cheonjiense]|uniref:Uncharacterized protein n=1 Tax=Chryseobacterium cheonjiense TaxID=2728845 RepID=A0A7Y0FHV7_9FLAO|nr:hypothetical protein [Chryseobacterium cheonjiense]NML56784.1 hypothetical protein [Chryseobacterium cheonjiense]
MKEKYLMLNTIEASSLQLAFIRSILTDYIYVEIDDTFIISCKKSLKDKLAPQLDIENIKYILVYVNEKSGGDVYCSGVNAKDEKKIKNIILL